MLVGLFGIIICAQLSLLWALTLAALFMLIRMGVRGR